MPIYLVESIELNIQLMRMRQTNNTSVRDVLTRRQQLSTLMTSSFLLFSLGQLNTAYVEAFTIAISVQLRTPLTLHSSSRQQPKDTLCRFRRKTSQGRHRFPFGRSQTQLQAQWEEDKDAVTDDAVSHRSLTWFAGLALACALVFLPAFPAHAGFGPSSGATTSAPPGLLSPKVQEQDLAGGNRNKLRQIIGSTLDERRLAEFSSQLDGVIEEIRLRQESGEGSTTQASSDSLLNAQALREQILQREALLDKLEAEPYWFNYLAAFIGSVTSTLVMHPVDTIKTRLQVQASNGVDVEDDEPLVSFGNATMHVAADEFDFLSALPPGLPRRESSRYLSGSNDSSATFAPSCSSASLELDSQQIVLERPVNDSLVDLEANFASALRDDRSAPSTETATTLTTATATPQQQLASLRDLYKGLTGNIIKEGPPSALYLGVYESVKHSLLVHVPSAEAYLLLVYLASGAVGELVGSVVRAPAEAVKSLVQTDDSPSDAANTVSTALSTRAAAQQILGTPEGRANIVRAWSASIWRDVPFGAIQLAIFEVVKAYILNNPNIVDFDSSTLFAEAIIGAFAGGCGSFVTNPADVVTTRIITQCSGDDDEECQPLGVVGMAQQIYEEGGLGAFFTGWQARVGYWAPSISIFLTCYCSVRQAGVHHELFM